MKRRRGARALGTATLALTLAAGCSAISGLGGLHFDESTSAGGGGVGGARSSSDSTSGSGGQCQTAADCKPRECLDVACKKNQCTIGASAVGTNCSKGVCDGHGSCVECVSPSDCPTAPTCRVSACTSRACTLDNASADTPCTSASGGHYCDGQGSCVACNTTIECGLGAICTNHACQDLCNDMASDNGETDVDCGGPCPPCANGKHCMVAGDCAAGLCVDGVCCDSLCNTVCHTCDGQNPGTCESVGKDVDDPGLCDATHGTCGGSGDCTCSQAGVCRRALGAPCGQPGQCASDVCTAGLCAP